jgi:hypothetical protein
MADTPENQSQSQPPQPTPQSPTPTPPARQRILPTVDPAKTINYRQDGVVGVASPLENRSKK